MYKDELLQRKEDLQEVIAWSLKNGGLTPGQRICLHQEIAGIFRDIAALDNNAPLWPTYRMPAHLQEKVQHIIKVIQYRKDARPCVSTNNQ